MNQWQRRGLLSPEMENHPHIPGLCILKNFMSKDDEEELVSNFESADWEEVVKRRSLQFGHYYNQAKKWIEKRFIPYPSYTNFVFERLHEMKIMHHEASDGMFLVQEYIPGQVLHPHIDMFGDIVIGINLLASTTMTFLNPETKEEIEVFLERRGLYVLSGDARYLWKHGLKNIQKRRLSITIRNLEVNERLNNRAGTSMHNRPSKQL